MPRGGSRKNSGRTPLVQTAYYGWVITRINEIGTSEAVMSERRRHHVKRTQPVQLANNDELTSNYQKLREASPAERQAMVANDLQKPLEETRAILSDDGFEQYSQIPPPNHFLLSRIYKQVAIEASERFQEKISLRNVKDCVAAWRKYERWREETPE
jgi:hypothetical protein